MKDFADKNIELYASLNSEHDRSVPLIIHLVVSLLHILFQIAFSYLETKLFLELRLKCWRPLSQVLECQKCSSVRRKKYSLLTLNSSCVKNQTCKTAVRISKNSVVQWTVQQKGQLKEIWNLKNKTKILVLSRIWTVWCLKKIHLSFRKIFSWRKLLNRYSYSI